MRMVLPARPWHLLALQAFGCEKVGYLVPNRFEFGYGLSPEIVELAARQQPDLIITVDNGIASISGVSRAAELGIPVTGYRSPPAWRAAAGGRRHRQP